MIQDTLDNFGAYAAAIPHFDAIQAFLSGDLASLSDGRHDIDGDRVFAMVSSDPLPAYRNRNAFGSVREVPLAEDGLLIYSPL